MKQSYILGAVVSMLFCLPADAQTNNEHRTKHTTAVTKGYYSIGNNASKIPFEGPVETREAYMKGAPQKGYYAIGENQNKQRTTVILRREKRTQKVQIQKGYYSIGNNAQKL